MKRSATVNVLASTTIVLAGLALYAHATMQDAAPPPFKPEAPTSDIMELNNELNRSLRRAWDNPDWEEVGHKVRLLAEIANVLQYHKPTSEKDWWRFAGAFRDKARSLIEAVNAKDASKAKEAHRALFSSCKQCHDKYKKD